MASLKFRQQLLDTKSVCFLQPNSTEIVLKKVYRWSDNQSKIAIQWLVFEEQRRSIEIIHADKCREARKTGVKFDGFCSKTRQVFEFYNYYYHGCPNCYKYNRNVPLVDNPTESLVIRHEATVAKNEYLCGEITK